MPVARLSRSPAVTTGWPRSLECFHLRSYVLQEFLTALLPEYATAAQKDVADEATAARLDTLRERMDLRLLEAAIAGHDEHHLLAWQGGLLHVSPERGRRTEYPGG